MNYDMLVGLLSGANGGVAYVYMSQPFDTIKVKMQMFPNFYKNALNCFLTTLKKDGVYRGLYAGTTPALMAHVVESAVLFCALEPCKRLVGLLVGRYHDELQPINHACAGGLAGVFASLIHCPTELVKCKQQAMREMIEAGRSTVQLSDIKPLKICRSIYRVEGVRGFFHGYSPTFVREVIGHFLFFGSYELTCYEFINFSGEHHRLRHDTTFIETAIAGGIAGIVTWAGIFPFDLVKSRIQITSGKGVPDGNVGGVLFIRMLVDVFRVEGLSALYKGLSPVILAAIPANAALFVAVEYTRKFMY